MCIFNLFMESWNSLKKMVMESHGEVMEFHFQISVGTLCTGDNDIQVTAQVIITSR